MLKITSWKILPLIIIWPVFCGEAQSNILKLTAKENGGFKAVEVHSGLDAPWGAYFINENELLITEKDGQLKLVSLKGTQSTATTIKGLPSIKTIGQGGLLDIKPSPNFTADQNFYVTYTDTVEGKNGYTLKLAKATLKDKRLVSDFQVLFTANYPSDGGRHFGSRITFDATGHLFFSMGDRGMRSNAQDLSIHSGSIFRLNLDGSVPKDNPFVNTPNAMPEIWSFGHRNPQGLFYDQQSQQLWSNEHGPRGGDEINQIQKGKNYGWPVIGYGKEYVSRLLANEATHREGMEQPVKQFTPSIAPSSLLVYSGKFYPELAGILFSGALKLRHLNVVSLNKNAEKPYKHIEQFWFQNLSERVRNVIESPAGYIYFMTDSGSLYRLIKV